MSEETNAAPSTILGTITKETPPPANPNVDHAHKHEDTWAWGEGIPGSGTRPDYLSEKYKSVEAQAKAYKELEKRLVAGEAKVPDSYDFGEHAKVIKTESEHVQKFVETARKNRLSQEAFNEVLSSLVGYEQSLQPNIDAEIAKLGENAGEKIEIVKRWAANNLSQEACDTLGAIGNRADVIKFVDELRQLSLHNKSSPPSAESANNFVRLTKEDWDKELSNPANAKRYVEDAGYRQEMQNKLKVIYGEE